MQAVSPEADDEEQGPINVTERWARNQNVQGKPIGAGDENRTRVLSLGS